MTLAARIVRAGVSIQVRDGRLLVQGQLTDEQRAFLAEHRDAIIGELDGAHCGICKEPGWHSEHRCICCDTPGHLACGVPTEPG